MVDKAIKTPEILWPALRQYQHNDCSGSLLGLDYNETLKILKEEIEKAYIAGKCKMGNIGYSDAQIYSKEIFGEIK